MSDKILPPLPKLRPKPGFNMATMVIGSTDILPTADDISPPPKKRKITHIPLGSPSEDSSPAKSPDIIEEDSKTSRLLTKSECGRGGGRKRSSGSSIHSIPKFTQVQCLAKKKMIILCHFQQNGHF